MSTKAYNTAVENGGFEGIYYTWSVIGDVYTIYMAVEVYQQFESRRTELREAGKTRIEMGETQYQNEMERGYFKGIEYSWSLSDGTYEILIPESQLRLYQNNEQGMRSQTPTRFISKFLMPTITIHISFHL